MPVAEAAGVEVVDNFSSKAWRLANLYFITDEDGKTVKFTPRYVQEDFGANLWYLNVILKSRQHGMSTYILLWILDECLFYENQSAGVIAHTLNDAKTLFRTKVDFPYRHLPEGLQEAIKANSDSADQFVFSNGSSIAVGTSMRSGTLQYLHVSEFGKIAAMYPEKAREIRTGAFNTVHQGNYIFVESTAEGAGGDFHDMCKESRVKTEGKTRLSKLDFKFHFYPWWRDSKNRLSMEDAASVVIGQTRINYFNDLETKWGIYLDLEQRAWYVKKAAVLGEDMKREHPSTPDEPFEIAIVGAYFHKEFVRIRKDQRITRVPVAAGIGVDTWWDIGVDDATAIWFTQTVGREIRLVHYFEESDRGLPYFIQYIKDWRIEKGAVMGKAVGPHDIEVREWGANATSRKETARLLGVRFVTGKKLDEKDQIDAARNALSLCVFDEAGCEFGIQCLEHYRKTWNEKMGIWSNTPVHDWSSHGSKAFMLMATMHNIVKGRNARAQDVQPVSPGGWT